MLESSEKQIQKATSTNQSWKYSKCSIYYHVYVTMSNIVIRKTLKSDN